MNNLHSIFGKTTIRNDVVVSLTTIPTRLSVLEPCIRSLINQSVKPDKVLLWLCEDGYFGRNAISRDSVPETISQYQQDGLVIKWTKNIGPFTKLIPSLTLFGSKKIVTADDDTIYPKKWLKGLLRVSDGHPGNIVCYRGSRMVMNNGKLEPYNDWPEFISKNSSLWLFPTGKDGVLYPPGVLSKEVFNEDVFKKLTPFADDVWFKAMSLLNGTSCKKIASVHRDYQVIKGSGQVELQTDNVGGNKNDEYLQRVFDKYELFDLLNGQY